MALNSRGTNRPDHSRLVVGDEGDEIHQESGTGKQVHRKGAVSAEADIDIATSSSPMDLADGDFESDQRSTGGAEALAGEVVSDDSATFSVFVDWMDDDGNVLITHNPAALTDVTDVDFNLIIRSDHFEVRISDTSGGQNRIHGTINSH